MSIRFYINDFQPFANNELGERTHKFLIDNGIEIDEDDGIIFEQEVTDVNGLLKAVERDTLQILQEDLTRVTYDEQDRKVYHPWSEITDKDILCDRMDSTWLKDRLYEKDESIPEDGILTNKLDFYLSRKRVFAPYFLKQELLTICDEDDMGNITLRDGCKCVVHMG